MKVVIVGGVAGGATAAARIRRLDENAQIIIFERTGFISYANCGLPYYIGGVITDKEELTLQTPDKFWDRFRIDARVRHEVTAIDPEKKVVKVRGLDTGKEYEESYDKLVLSPGAKPLDPGIAGTDGDRVFTLRTVEDTFRIREFVVNEKPAKAVVAGGGFIGLEVAENLKELGVDVTIIQSADHLLPPLDSDMAAIIHARFREEGVKLMLNSAVTGFEEEGAKVITHIKDAEDVEADMVIFAIGVAPETKLAKDIGLELGVKGSIVVNDRMETSVKDIYALGDAVQVMHRVTGEKAVIALAGPANKQGRIVADNICGKDSRYKGSQGSSVIKIFDMTVATTGINEAQAKAAGIDHEKIILAPSSHAGYYPGAKAMTLKLIFERETEKILGSQIVGYDGVDKRSDVIATAIFAGLNASELKDLDLAYAPPYSSAKDPVNMAGFVAENIEKGRVKQFHVEELVDVMKKDASFIDARTPEEYERGHVEGFVNIPVDDLRERYQEIPLDKPVYVMCQSGLRSYIATRILAQLGYDTYNFSGGYRFYQIVKNDIAGNERIYPCGMDRK